MRWAEPALDRIGEHARLFAGRRIGLAANQASLDSALVPALDRLRALPGVRVERLFAPEHGLAGLLGAGEADADGIDPASGLPVVALYGPRTRPAPAHLAGLDLLVADLPDVGVRAYTYLATLLGLCEATAEAGLPVVVLDRPNPLGGAVEGGGVAPGAESFVAPFDLPLRHGLTLGEAARLFCAERGLAAPAVLPCAGWRRRQPIAADAVWVAPSPSLPTAPAAFAYAGTVLIEGTALSEGRGTSRPFTLIGAPGLDGAGLARTLRGQTLPGCLVRPAAFRPAASKHAGAVCEGIELYVADRTAFRALPPVLAILGFVRDRQPELLGPLPFLDRLAGGPALRTWCGSTGVAAEDLLSVWAADQPEFARRAAPCRLYPEPDA